MAKKMTQKQWLEIKSHSIGGSEIAAIMGMNPYKTIIDVYVDKTEGSKTITNIPMRAGTILEPLVADLFAEETGCEIIIPENKIYFHKDYDFLVGSPDRFYKNDSGIGILECKTSGVNYDKIPEFWTLQLMWYMGIIGSDFGTVAWLKNNREFQYADYEFVSQLFDLMVNTAVNFWNNNVLQHNPPKLNNNNKSEVSKIFKEHIEGKMFLSNPEMDNRLITLAKVKAIIKHLETIEADLTDSVKLAMQDAESIINKDNKILCTWRKDKNSLTFDTKKFKEDNPELYQKYLIEKTGTRKFLLKQKEILPKEFQVNDDEVKAIISGDKAQIEYLKETGFLLK